MSTKLNIHFYAKKEKRKSFQKKKFTFSTVVLMIRKSDRDRDA